jgi:DNA-cytosine methyltransferase
MPYAKRINPCGFILRHSIGGFSLGLERAGFKTVVFCEQDKFCQKVLKKHWPGVPIEPDIKTFDGKKYAGAFILTGGFPCQPFSCAGKRRGKEDDRALWPEMFRVIQEVRPHWIIGENVAGFIGMGLDESISDLEREGYSVQAFIIPACAVNAPHRRDRVWIVANRRCEHGERGKINGEFNRPLSCEKNASLFERPTSNDGQRINTYATSSGCVNGRSNREERHIQDSSIRKIEENKSERDRRLNRIEQTDCHAPDTESNRWGGSPQSEMGGEEMERGRGCGLDDSDKDVTYSSSEGLQEGEFDRGTSGEHERETRSRCSTNYNWDEPWLEVASEFCGIYDGISDWIHRHYDRIISEEDYETTTTKDRTEGVQILWKAIQSEEIWEQVGRILQIPKKGILLTLLFYFQGESIKKGEQVESAEMGNNKVLRNLWNNSGFKCSSQRLKLHEQRGKELTDIMPELSFQTARIFAKITDYIICGESTMSNSNRVNRLKALGNAVVPQIPEIIGRTIMEIENENHN